MKVFLDENFLIKEIVDNHIDVIVKGSTNFDEIKIYIPTSLKEQYTAIYPTYSVKRADGREIGIYNTLSTTDLSETGYYGWKGHFQQRDIAVAGALQVTFNFNMTKDDLYQSKAIQMITTKVENAIYVDNEFLVIGDGNVESIVDTMNDMKVEMAQLEDTVKDAAETAQEAAAAVADKLSQSDGDARYIKRTDKITNAEIDALFN